MPSLLCRSVRFAATSASLHDEEHDPRGKHEAVQMEKRQERSNVEIGSEEIRTRKAGEDGNQDRASHECVE